MKSKDKRTFRRYLIVKGCPFDFGLGIGVVYRDEVTFTDARRQGFDTASFQMPKQELSTETILKHVTMFMEPKRNKARWNMSPEAALADAKPLPWIVQTYSYDKTTRTGRWITYRHRIGSKDVARFGKLAVLRNFVRNHGLALGQRCRAVNTETKEQIEIRSR